MYSYISYIHIYIYNFNALRSILYMNTFVYMCVVCMRMCVRARIARDESTGIYVNKKNNVFIRM